MHDDVLDGSEGAQDDDGEGLSPSPDFADEGKPVQFWAGNAIRKDGVLKSKILLLQGYFLF